MCLNTKPEPKCFCADGYILDDDEETCIGNYHSYDSQAGRPSIYTKLTRGNLEQMKYVKI